MIKCDSYINYSKELESKVIELSRRISNSTDKNLLDAHVNFYFNKEPHLQRLKGLLSNPQLQQLFESKKNPKILEIGSGIGTNCLLMKAIFPDAEVCGAEPCPGSYEYLEECIYMLKDCNTHLPYTYKKEGGESLSFEDGTFDFIYSFEVLEHVQNPEKVFKEIYRLLKKDGFAYISTCNYDSFYEGHYKIFWNPFIGVEGNRKRIVKKGLSPQFLTELNFITKKKIKKWTKEIGFENVIFNPLNGNLTNLNITSIFPQDFNMPVLQDFKPVWLHRKIESPIVANFLAKFDRDYKIYLLLQK